MAHLSEYATLKAIGYSNFCLVKTLLSQSTLLAILAFPPSLTGGVRIVLFYITALSIPIRMTWEWIGLVLALTLLMCNAAGVFAYGNCSRPNRRVCFKQVWRIHSAELNWPFGR